MRLATTLAITALALTATAQNENPYAVIEAAVAASQGQANIVVDVGGWQQAGRQNQRFQLRLFAKEGKFHAEQFVDGTKLLAIVADGTKVWRYDPILNEYTFMNQPEDFVKTLSLVTGWSRTQLQRPMRALAGSVRWMVAPQFETGDNWVRVFQTRPFGEDWRGTDARFTFDDRSRLDRLTIEDRLDLMTGFQHTWLEAQFAYPQTLNVDFTFKPPAGSRPAADLPARLSGDGG